MQRIGTSLQLSASDLVGYLNCRHLTSLDRSVADGALKKPSVWDPLLDILWERGSIHEQNYIDHLRKAGHDIVEIHGGGIDQAIADQTFQAMRAGAEIIVQGAFLREGWGGRTDVLRRVSIPSDLGDWSYEVTDTKLARETKGGAILQLCLYSDLVSTVQGRMPEYMHVVTPWSNFEPQTFRIADYGAYYRKVKRGLEQSLTDNTIEDTYPDPKQHCDICRWYWDCDARRRQDDHLCLVAGITKVQINELKRRGIGTMAELAEVPLPLAWKPDRGAAKSYERIREQARVQIQGRTTGRPVYETLPLAPGFGLTRLPFPSAGDVFLDLEGDPFVGDGGFEYLFGCVFTSADGTQTYKADWALSREDEKRRGLLARLEGRGMGARVQVNSGHQS